jgi:hypothetical protein
VIHVNGLGPAGGGNDGEGMSTTKVILITRSLCTEFTKPSLDKWQPGVVHPVCV